MEKYSEVCPYCGARLSVAVGQKRIRCEYCESEVILDKNNDQDITETVQPIVPPPAPAAPPVSKVSDYKKWRQTVTGFAVAEFVIMILATIMTTSDSNISYLGVFLFLFGATISFAAPFPLAIKRPAGPDDNNPSKPKRSTAALGFLIYGLMFLAFWLGMIFGVIFGM